MDIDEYKKIMTDQFIGDETVKDSYNLTPGRTFDDQFSVTSLESIIFSNVATSMWTMQELFEQFKRDITFTIDDQMPGTANWYAYKARMFQYGVELIDGTDRYDNTGLTDEQVEAMRIVKFAAAVESRDSSLLRIKIASEDGNGKRTQLTPAQLTAFTRYIQMIKYAGVRVSVVDHEPDHMRLNIDIYYDPLVLNVHGQRLDGTGDNTVQDVIRNHLSNLQFNGMYSNQALVDTLQVLDGVRIAEIKHAASKFPPYAEFTAINAFEIADAGFYQISDENLILNFIPYNE
jgi:hypothetical protein